ncbi:enoyl-CoA hydratase-related protein [Nocardioides zeae]|uniref:Enoyl-CoA hydratase-related protein n=1 Tax=Nocardioides imazamoxiresistens TaxID=3231893 RepID=A0ABU3PRX0_9ACTN|nr:enoyl-CoA hydratase-related protein [Nocardioides zeae]MDT9591976.1 enoyl-CoA hydratase-related protein [Nocardioides zeae]
MPSSSEAAGPPAWATGAPGVEITLDAGLLRVRFDRPETYNGLDAAVVEACSATLERCRGRDDVRVVVLTGTGPAFSSGATVAGDDPVASFDRQAVERANRLVRAVVALDKPVVAAVNGVAAGVGASLAFACDLQVVAAEASFALAFAKIGLMPDGGATATVAAAIGRPRAMRLALTGERLGASEAYAAGLVSHLAEPGAYETTLAAVTTGLLAGAPLAHSAAKKAVNAATLGALEDALDRENLGQLALLGTADAAEGMAAFVARRPPRFTGR